MEQIPVENHPQAVSSSETAGQPGAIALPTPHCSHRRLIAAVVIGMLLSVAACDHSTRKFVSWEDAPIRVTDFRGQKLALEKPAGRIVCLIESALSGLYMLGADSLIVGVPAEVYKGDVARHYAALDPRIGQKSLPAPGNWDFVGIENVIALKPDLVILWASQAESIAAIESKGIPVYAVMLNSIGDVYKEIADLGVVTGKSSRADSLISSTKNTLRALSFSEPDGHRSPVRKRVYFMWPQGPLETSGRYSTANELIMLAGLVNACPDPDEHLVVNLERVIEWNPDMIVMWNNPALDPDDIMKLQGWNQMRAVKDKQVFELPSVFWCDLWTLKFQYAVKLLAAWSGKLSDYDPAQESESLMFDLYGRKGVIPDEQK